MTAIYPDLDGASIFLTGGGSGIGAALLAGFLAQGAKVAFVDFCDASALVDTLAATSAHAPLFIKCDVTDTEALHAAMEQAHATHGPFKALINNAANDMRYEADAITPDIWDASQAVNLKAQFFACQKAAGLMAPKGAMINYASITYMMGAAGMVPYVTAKAAIVGMTRALAREWGAHGLRVNAIAPGWVMTEKQETMWATPEAKAEFIEKQCLKEHIQPGHMVGPTLFLASDASAMMTGQVMVVDAGVVHAG
ncbi:SDR family oxidoreductase [Cognatiyoonia sp. IB215446]|uniref:SDR family NAD(P)-dependent oxidoreductase n=1 Tax=Cognatiyoonia sp. IB215446 TaxID=3097355 RepID=UPI002A0ED5E3|nr:SDR family oxidoreductase [Cognatiyoonia sp. IB215446]MDX8347443.1 SDR family oxidoreductase [Cognatiyoonia sp. IB215446]